MTIQWIPVSFGYAAYVGELKVAVLTTSHYLGKEDKGVSVVEPMERAAWTLHFTSPIMPIGVVEAILKSVPAAANTNQKQYAK